MFRPHVKTSRETRAPRRRSHAALASTAGILTLTLTLDPFALGSIAPVLADEASPYGMYSREAAFADFLNDLGQETSEPAVPIDASMPVPGLSMPLETTPFVLPPEDEELVVLADPAPASAMTASVTSVTAQTSTPPPGTPVAAEVGGIDLEVQTADDLSGPDAVVVRVAGASETAAAGVEGILLNVTDASVATPVEPEVELTVSYETFAGLGGSDWASRLRMVWLPECSATVVDCAPQVLPTVNDAAAQTVTAVVPVQESTSTQTVGFASASASTVASGSAGGGSIAVAAGVSGSQGNWGATSLSPAATWGNSGNTGSFAWSMPLSVPSPAAGPSPELALSYSSSASDGRLPSTNNQTGPIGEGFDLTSAYIERTYTPCMDDETSSSNNQNRPSGDLCWGVDNATMVFNGGASELVRAGTTNVWHSKFADGTKVERLTGASNDGERGEYWKVTTTDGTQYFFGREPESGEPSYSAWTVPVFGNHSGEPCYDADFEDAKCTQVYRWNLEHVIDPVGNTMSYFYAKETNHYLYDIWGSGTRSSTEQTASYTAGGHLVRIDYGTRVGQSEPAPAQVRFTYRSRCITDLADPDSFCTGSTVPVSDHHWPDTPVDLVCTPATDEDCSFTPAFFTRSRLDTVSTWAHDGTDPRKITSWKLGQSFRPQGEGTSLEFSPDPMLVLTSITETGHGGTVDAIDDIQRPSVDFRYEFLRNRVDIAGLDRSPMPRPRISSITTEAGATVTVGYRTECGVNDGGVPGTGDTEQRDNTRLCYPVKWFPEGAEDEVVEYFHKYVVESISEAGASRIVETGEELVTGSLIVETSFDYEGGAAWKKPTGAMVKPKEMTYSEFRGFATVLTTVGTAGQERASRTEYFRGLGDGATLSAGPTGQEVTSLDLDRFQGQVFSAVEHDGTVPISQVITVPGTPVTVATQGSRTATRIPSTTTHGFTFAADGSRDFRTKTITTSNTHSQVETVNDLGDVSITSDDVCTTVDYAHDGSGQHASALAARFQLSLVESTKVTATDCDAAGASTAEVISWDTAEYDALGQTVESHRLDPADGDGHVLVKEVLAYDSLGRPTSVADALGNVSTMAYTHSTGGLLQSLTSTSPDPDGAGPAAPMSSTTTFNPLTGMVVSTTDANGRTTTGEYDALGRLVKVWYPQHDTAGTPSLEYDYQVVKTGLNSVLTRTLGADGTTQHVSVTHYDGLLRPFQYQSESVNAGPTREADAATRGQMVSHVYYDSAGRPSEQISPWHATGAPSLEPVTPPNTPASQTTLEYDGAGRQVAQVFWIGTTSEPSNEQWRSVTHYDGARTLQIPPMGATPQLAVMDGRGRTVELRQYLRDPDDHAGADTAAEVLALAHQSTSYTFDVAGQMVQMRDAENNLWSYDFDHAGRQVSASDPDGGTTATTYDQLNRVVTRTNGNGETVAYNYDALGRTLSLHDGSPTGPVRASWEYDTALDEDGNPVLGAQASSTRFIDGNAYTTRVDEFDDAYRPLSTTMELPDIPAFTNALQSRTFTSTYSYTADGQVAEVTHPAIVAADGTVALGSEVVTTQFDTASTPSWMGGGFGWGIYVAASSFHADGRLQAMDLGNTYSAYLSYAYEHETKRLAGITLNRQQHATELDLRYAYDDAGNVLSIKDQVGVSAAEKDNQCFGYDGLQRLTVAWTAANGDCDVDQSAITASAVGGVSPYWTEFSYDPLGNRTAMVQHGIGADATVTSTYEHGAGGAGPHQLTGVTEVSQGAGVTVSTQSSFAYDDAGNRVSATVDGVLGEYVWDVEGELVEAGGESYSYDASGTRMLRESAAGLTVYLPGGQELLIAAGAEGPEVSATRYYSFAGRMVAMRTGGGLAAVTSLVADHQGTLVAAVPNTNWTAGALQRLFTNPFGGARGGSADLPGDRGFLGAVEDGTGLTLLGARYYDPQVGSFISVDPLLRPSVPAHFHAYAYGFNNPVTHSDPSGLEPRDKNGNFDGNPYGHKKPASTSNGSKSKGSPSKSGNGLTAAGTIQAVTRNGLIQASNLSYDLLVAWMQSEKAQTLYEVGNRNRGLVNDLLKSAIAMRGLDDDPVSPEQLIAIASASAPSREQGESAAAVWLMYTSFRSESEWDVKVHLEARGVGSFDSGAVYVGESGGHQVRSDVFGNVNYGAMMALFGVDEEVAVSASNSPQAGTGRSDPADDHNIRVGYEMVRQFPQGVSSREYLQFILQNGESPTVLIPSAASSGGVG